MTTSSTIESTVPITIVCPDWCTVSPEQHAAELWAASGKCFHHAADIEGADPTAHRAPRAEPRYYSPICLSLSTTTMPDGREAESPTFRIDEQEHSLEQMLALAEAIQRAVDLYRSTGAQS